MKRYIVVLAIVTASVIGYLYQNSYDILPVLGEYRREYANYLVVLEKMKREDFMATATPWERFIAETVRLSKEHNFAPQVAIAQCAHESGRGKSEFAKTRNNFCGIAAYDSNPEMATYFQTPEECAKAWVYLISSKPWFRTAWNNRNDKYKMLVAIKAGGYATDRNYVSKVMSMPEYNLEVY